MLRRVYLGYITGQIAATYTDSFMVNTVFAQQQGGLFVNRPAAAVLFGARDGLLSYLTPASPFVAYFKNATTEAPGFTTMHTGKDDVAQVGREENEKRKRRLTSRGRTGC